MSPGAGRDARLWLGCALGVALAALSSWFVYAGRPHAAMQHATDSVFFNSSSTLTRSGGSDRAAAQAANLPPPPPPPRRGRPPADGALRDALTPHYAKMCAQTRAMEGRASSLRQQLGALSAENDAMRTRVKYYAWEAAAARLFCRVVLGDAACEGAAGASSAGPGGAAAADAAVDAAAAGAAPTTPAEAAAAAPAPAAPAAYARVLRLWSDQAARAHTILGAQGQEGEEMLSPLSDAARVLSAPRGAAAAAAPGAWGRGGEQAAGVLRDSVLGVLSAGPANGSRAPPDPPGPHASFAETVASALLRLTGGQEAAAAARAMTLPAFARSSSEFNVRAAAALRDLEHLEAELLGDGGAAPAPGLAALRQDAERRRAELEALASGAALLVYTLARRNPAAIMGIEAYNLDRLEMLAAPARPPPPAPDPDPPADDAALGDEDALGRAEREQRGAKAAGRKAGLWPPRLTGGGGRLSKKTRTRRISAASGG